MFKGLVRAPQREAYDALKRKVDEYARNPRARTFRHVSPRAALKQIEKIEAKTMKLLENHRRWYLALYYDLRAESQLDWIERQIDENLA